jgi:hypothetical protein
MSGVALGSPGRVERAICTAYFTSDGGARCAGVQPIQFLSNPCQLFHIVSLGVCAGSRRELSRSHPATLQR